MGISLYATKTLRIAWLYKSVNWMSANNQNGKCPVFNEFLERDPCEFYSNHNGVL